MAIARMMGARPDSSTTVAGAPAMPAVGEQRDQRVCDLPSLAAFATYLGLSVLFFGRSLVGHFSQAHLGVGPDPGLMMWFLVWWPHAIANGLNPFITHAVWTPAGFNLAWQTSVPLASLVAAPLTFTTGPVVAFNVLCLLGPALDAWGAFILCRYLSGNRWAGLFGGYVFGFSAFTLAALRFGHLHLLLTVCVPLIAYVVARRLLGEIGERAFVTSLSGLLLAQFLLSTEIFATLTMFGAITLAVGWWLNPVQKRQHILALLKPILLSYTLTALATSLYCYYFFVHFERGAIFPGSQFSIDLVNFLVPTRLNELGCVGLFERLSDRFAGGWSAESVGYIGPALILMAALQLKTERYDHVAKTCAYSLLIVCVLALGPVLHVAGFELPAGLPWLLLGRLPLLDNALPSRFSLYAFLLIAIIAATWLASTRTTRMAKI